MNEVLADTLPLEQLTYSWIGSVDLRTIVEKIGTPVFVYSEAQLLKNLRRVEDAAAAAGLLGRVELYIPFFPNSNPHLLKSLQARGHGVLLQLPSEYDILNRFCFDKFIVSPGHVSNDEIGFWAQKPYPTFLSSLDEVAFLLESSSTAPVSVRIDSLGSGKPGIKYAQLDQLTEMLQNHQRAIDSFEVYCGSGNSLEDMSRIVEEIFVIFKRCFPRARAINFAGGHGFVYERWEEDHKHFDWGAYFSQLAAAARRLEIPESVVFMFEPARDILADIGALVLGVKRDVICNPGFNQVVTDGSRMLMPSAQLRDRRHNVVFLDGALKEVMSASGVRAALRGRTILRHDYILPGEYWVPEGVGAGGHAVILDVGAYCATQHMEFLNVPSAPEVVIDCQDKAHLVTAPADPLDKWRNLLPERRLLS